MTSSFSRPICTLIALSAFLTASADLSAQTYNVTKVVSTSTPYPEGGYWSLYDLQPPSIDGGKIYFFNSGPSNTISAIWSQDLTTGQQTKLLSTSDAAPGGVGNFTDLGAYTSAPLIRNGLMTILTTDQSTAVYPLGWYTFQPGSGNAPNLVLNYNNTPGFGHPGNGAPTGRSTDGTHVSLTYGSNPSVYTANADGSGLLNPYQGVQFQDPSGCHVFPFAYWAGASVSGNNVAFRANSEGDGVEDLYVKPITGLPPTDQPTCFGQYDEIPVIGPTTLLPGDPNTADVANAIASTNFILDGNTLYYIIADKNAAPFLNGAYYSCVMESVVDGTPPKKIACSNDSLPGLANAPFQFKGISESNGVVAFVATGVNGSPTGLYTYQNGNISKVVASGDVVDGYTISSSLATTISISNTALENGVIAFWARASTDEYIDFVAQPAPAAAITLLNQTGWVLPETITPVSSFGSLQNQFLIPDDGTGYVYSVPVAGGTPSNFATLGTPSSYFDGEGSGGASGGVLINSGLFAGNYFAAGYNYTDPDPANSVYSGALFTVSPSGTSNIVYQAPGTATTATGGEFGTPIVAPNGFGQIGGEILVPQLISNAIQLVTPTSATSASLSPFATLSIAPFGLLFAPAGFGSVGGDLLVSGYDSGTILSVNSAGTVTTFATSTLAQGQVGLREMAIAPAGFGTYGGDLFVSVGASTGGGGINGAVDVFNPQGVLVAVLTQPTVGVNFDPRGFYFANAGQLYISNSVQGLVVATPAAFTPAAAITLENLLQTYTGSPASPVTVTTNPAGLAVAVTYSSSAYPSSTTPPTSAGSYTVTAVITAPGYTGIAAATLGIEKADATITLGNLAQTYTGSPATPVAATTNPTGLAVALTYSGANYNTSTTPPTAAGSYLVTATITDPNYTGSTTGTLVISAAPPTSPVTYLGLDSTTQGQWTGKYGSDGYQIANGATSLPAYATVSFTGASLYTWAPQTTDPRALQTAPSSTTGIASSYYANPSFNINLNLTDGNSHRVALYLLDWDTTARNETISILDATTHAVLDSESFSGFHNGQWAAWNIKGNVIIQVKNNMAYGNATISGIFFGPATSTAPPVGPPGSSSATYNGLDATTQGAWTGKYGGDGYQIANGATKLPAYATVSITGDSTYTWAPQTTDPRALQTSSGSSTGIASTYYANASFDINLNLTDSQSHVVALYLLDFDTTSRAETITIYDTATNTILDSESFSGFHNGQWAIWTIKGDVIIQVTSSNSSAAVVSGLFFGPAGFGTPPPPPPPTTASASYAGLDATTEGGWTGQYGGDGYQIANGASSLPAYATVSLTGDSTYTWAANTTDPRALQTSSGASTRIASAYYANSTFNINVNLTDGNSHTVALYLLDFDTTARAETIKILDASSNTVLDTESFSGFHNGQWAVWTIKGNVIIQITSNNSSTAAVSGIFFGPAGTVTPPSSPSASATYSGLDITTEGQWTGKYGSDGYQIANGAVSLPSYATLVLTGDSTYTWAGQTTDPRALQSSPGSATGTASTYYASASFNLNLDLADGNTHKVSLYLLDWDTTSRAETIKILDAATNTVLDSESFSGFHTGQWATWQIKGNVIIQIQTTNYANAAVSGIFFN